MASNSIANLLLRIVSQKGDAADDVGELAAALEVLDHTSAEAKAGADVDQGNLDAFVTQLNLLDHSTYDAQVKADVDFSQLDLFTKALDDVQSKTFKGQFFKGGGAGAFTELTQGTEQLKFPVEVDGEKAKAEAAALNAQLSFELKDQDVNVDVDKRGTARNAIAKLGALFSSLGKGAAGIGAGGINAAEDALGGLAQAGAGIEEALAGAAGGLGKVTVNVGMFGLSLGPAVAGVLALGAAIITSLIAALAALAASAIIAAGALAALGVAFIAALGPMVAIAIPAVLGFSKVLKVLQQQQTESANASMKKAQADAQARTYAIQHANAERTLADAVVNAADAKKQAYREMQDAIERVTDAQLGLQRAELSQQQAALNVDKAKLALKKFRQEAGLAGKDFDAMFKQFNDVGFNPAKLNKALAKVKGPGQGISEDKKLQGEQLILDLKDANLGVKEAQDHTRDSQVELTRARQDAQPYLDKGITGSKNYAAALDRVTASQRDLKQLESDRKFDLKQQSQTQSGSAISALTDQQKKLLAQTKLVIAAFKEAFGPGATALMTGIIAAMGSIAGAMKPLQPALTALGTAMGGAIAAFGAFLATPAMKKLFISLIAGATALAPLIGQIFGPLLDLLTKIAVAAMPYLIQAFQIFAGWLGQLDKNTSVQDIADIIKQMIPYLQAWFDLAMALLPAFFNLLVAIAPYGLVLLKWITGVANKLAAWAKSKKGRDEIKQFFADAIPLVKRVAGWVKWVFDFIIDLVGAVGRVERAWKTFKTTVTNLINLGWKNSGFYDIVQWIKHELPKIWEKFVSKTKSVISWIKGLPDRFYNFGKDLIQGLIDGVSNMAGALKDAVTGVITKPFHKVKKFFHIGSPSRLMMEMGQNVGRGFELGISASASRITSAASRSLVTPVAHAGAVAGSGVTIQSQTVNLPAAPGHDQMGDPRHQAAQFALEMRRRGRQ